MTRQENDSTTTTQQAETAHIADDLFAGAGGWDVGAAEVGIHARGVEIMQEARETRDAAGLTTIHDDVWTFWPDGRATGKIASPPCPTFSSAGGGSGRRALDSVLCAIDDGAYRDLDQLRTYPVGDHDDRTRLVLTPLHFATQHDYEWLAWEQVPAVLPVWEACAAVLRDLGWHVWTGKVHSEQFGVPQTRTRAVLIASRRHAVTAPIPTHSRYYSHRPEQVDLGVAPWISMAQALGWTGPGHVELQRGAGLIDRHGPRRGRDFSEPAPTVRAGTKGSGPNFVITRPTGVSRMQPPEAATLQAFPSNFPFRGGKSRVYEQIGNAVPPRMAMHILAVAAGISIKELAA